MAMETKFLGTAIGSIPVIAPYGIRFFEVGFSAERAPSEWP